MQWRFRRNMSMNRYTAYVIWYNSRRPHQGLCGLTPTEKRDGGVHAIEIALSRDPAIPFGRATRRTKRGV